MDLRPWAYWTRDGRPYEGTDEAVALLESVMKRDPNHPGALHYYIHLIEPTSDPGRAVPAADRLLTLMPAAGHMVHMPSHIYQRVGRYADAVRSNELASRADEDYISQCQAQGLYPMGYYPHNIHFLWRAATMNGQGGLAVESARKLAARIPDDVLKQMPMFAGFRVVPYFALTRFGMWDQMLAEPAPPPGSPYLEGIWHYARGLAFVAKGQIPEAERALAEVKRISGDKALDQPMFSPNTMAAVFAIAPEVLGAEIASARKDYDSAIDHRNARSGWMMASRTEPAEWHYPPRQALAAVLPKAGRPPRRNGLLGGPEAQPGERLVASRIDGNASGGGQAGGIAAHREAVQGGVVERRRAGPDNLSRAVKEHASRGTMGSGTISTMVPGPIWHLLGADPTSGRPASSGPQPQDPLEEYPRAIPRVDLLGRVHPLKRLCIHAPAERVSATAAPGRRVHVGLRLGQVRLA
jgi:hypothetical protein